jgi:N-succinyldiaminopimelate aminotransferase
VLPGSFLGREHDGVNPGAGYIRIALVAQQAECAEGVARLLRFAAGS